MPCRRLPAQCRLTAVALVCPLSGISPRCARYLEDGNLLRVMHALEVRPRASQSGPHARAR